MSDLTKIMAQETIEKSAESGAIIFFRLPPTNRLTEFMTLAFCPLFFGVVMTALISGFAGHIVGAGLGGVLAIVFISYRRRGARWGIFHTEKRERKVAECEEEEEKDIPHNNMILLSEIVFMIFEVGIIGLVSSGIILISFNHSGSNFANFNNNYTQYINIFFSYYRASL